MKVKQISEHIWSLKSWMIIPVHVWLVVDDEGLTLIDAGMGSMAKGILQKVKELNIGPLKRILLTHGHSDHVGAIKTIRKEWEVPVHAHSIEIPYLDGELPYPGRKKAIETVAKGITTPLPMDELGRLTPLGGLTPYLCPGHSPGHVVYFHEQDRVLLAGDLFTSKKGKLNRPMPMFTADMGEAIKSSAILRELNPDRVEVCHGDPVMQPAAQLDEYIGKFS